jgi:hypothetical protein
MSGPWHQLTAVAATFTAGYAIGGIGWHLHRPAAVPFEAVPGGGNVDSLCMCSHMALYLR